MFHIFYWTERVIAAEPRNFNILRAKSVIWLFGVKDLQGLRIMESSPKYDIGSEIALNSLILFGHAMRQRKKAFLSVKEVDI